jgi:hypothetical protein
MNGSKTFSLPQIIDVPSGRPAKLSGGLSAEHGSVSGSGTSFTFTPAKDYRGPAAIHFNVDDGKDPGQASDRITPITLNVTVGAKDQSDVPPTFTPPKVQIEPGEAAKTVDLRAASYHPNPQIKSQLKYTDLQSGTVNGVTATLSGSTLSVKAPVDKKPGTTATFNFKVVPPKGDPIDGSVDVTVTSSTRPLAQQKNAPQKLETKRGTAVTQQNAVGTDYWVNPFPDTPLKIVDATLANAPKGVTVSHTDNSITVTPSSGADIGTVSVNYHVQDATKDPNRTKQVIGQLQVTIHDRPSTPAAPSNASASDTQATFTITAPANNGKAITAYQVKDSATGKTWAADAGKNTISNLKNGQSYAFEVRAQNADGWSDWSPASATVTPYGKPDAPGSAHLSKNSTYAKSTFDMSWSAVTGSATGGLRISYEWKFDGNSGTITGTSRTTGKKDAGNYSFSVRTVGTKNNGDKVYSGWTDSNTVTLKDAPQASLSLSRGQKTGYEPGCHNGNCYYYIVTASNFDSGNYTINLHCAQSKTSPAFTSYSVSVSGSNWSWSSDSVDAYCGYENAYVDMGGKTSNTVDFNP